MKYDGRTEVKKSTAVYHTPHTAHCIDIRRMRRHQYSSDYWITTSKLCCENIAHALRGSLKYETRKEAKKQFDYSPFQIFRILIEYFAFRSFSLVSSKIVFLRFFFSSCHRCHAVRNVNNPDRYSNAFDFGGKCLHRSNLNASTEFHSLKNLHWVRI